MDKLISIVIATYHSKTLKYVLDKLIKQTYKNFEVIITDDGSEDFKFLKDNPYPYLIKYVWHPDVGRTWSWAHNEGIRLARGEYLFFLHDDVIPEDDLLEKLVPHLDEDTIVTGVRHTIPRKKRAYKNPSKYVIMKDHRLKFNDISLGEKGVNVWKENQVLYLDDYFGNSYHMVSGCIMAMPTKLVREIGGCAEDYPGWGLEDYDLAIRLKRKGCRIIMVCNARGYHADHKELDCPEVRLNQKEFRKRESDPTYINNFNYKNYVNTTAQ